jgi:hypothetical protein
MRKLALTRRATMAAIALAGVSTTEAAKAAQPITIDFSQSHYEGVTFGGHVSNGYLVNAGSFFLGVTFANPVKDVSLSLDRFGSNLSVLTVSPNPVSWVVDPNNPPGTVENLDFGSQTLLSLSFFNFGAPTEGFGIDFITYTPTVVATPAPLGGAGLPALLLLAGSWFWRRRHAL